MTAFSRFEWASDLRLSFQNDLPRFWKLKVVNSMIAKLDTTKDTTLKGHPGVSSGLAAFVENAVYLRI